MKIDDYLEKSFEKPIKVGEMEVLPVWFDSMGAKSMCTFIKTPDIGIMIDPGVAVMQPSYPMEDEYKEKLEQKAIRRIKKYLKQTDIVIITHYHYDHHRRPVELPEAYLNKQLYIKNPNKWINYSQWERTRTLYKDLLSLVECDIELNTLKKEPEQKEFKDPYTELQMVHRKDFGDYAERHEELMDKWRKRMEKTVEIWKDRDWLREFQCGNTEINFIKGGRLKFGKTRITFTEPFFHGIEYAKTGWVNPVTIEHGNYKFIHSSDLHGPTVEDYAQWIIDNNPDILILDGPATYLYGYLLNKTNLYRSINNALRILDEAGCELIIYDHHLLREKKFREHMEPFYDRVNKKETKVLTSAEHYGIKPLIDIL